MPINNNIIIRLIFSFLFFAITLRVLIPLFFDFVKKKMPGHYPHESDIDQMIRRQKERLRAEQGLTSSTSKIVPNQQVQKIFHETKWGGGAYSLAIQKEIINNYSYSITESKINAFLLLCEKKHYFEYLDSNQRNSESSLKNFLVTLLLFFLLSEELREKKFFIIDKMAKKISIPPLELALALQIKILLILSQKKELKENQIFTNQITISQYSQESVTESIEQIAKDEANRWAQGLSLFFEELTLVLNYAKFLSPLPLIKHKNDLTSAYILLKMTPEHSTESIKAHYKKWAQQKHPDKIISQKLPKFIEKQAILNWGHIQEAYDIVMNSRK